MSTSLENLNVKIGIDMSDLTKGIREINAQFKQIDSSVRATSSGFDVMGDASGSLKTKIEGLSQKITLQKEVIQSLKDAYTQSSSETGKNSSATEALGKKVNDATSKLNGMQLQLKDNNIELAKQPNLFSKIGDSLDKASTKMVSTGKTLSMGLTLPIVAFGAIAVKSASDFQETMNKVDVAFGDSAEEVKNWAQTSIKQFGMAQQTALDMTALYGDMATGMGLNQKEAAKLGMNLTGLAGDLSSFKNVQLDVAKTALASIFTGETESLKQMGIVMTQTNLEQFAMEKGLLKVDKTSAAYKTTLLDVEKAQKTLTETSKKYGKNSLEVRDATNNLTLAQTKLQESGVATIANMTEEEKIQLRYAFVVEKSKNAVGDFSRTSDSTANQVRIAQETYKEMSRELGENLLPTVNKVIVKITELMTWFTGLDEDTQNLILKIAGLTLIIGPTLWAFGEIIRLAGIAKGGLILFKVLAVDPLTGSVIALNVPLLLTIGAFAALAWGITTLMTNWSKMNGIEKTVGVLGAIAIAAAGAAIAVGALQSAWSLGLAAAAIVAGTAAIAFSVNSAQSRVKGYRTGLDYVPYDEFPAFLHKGERVLTAAESSSYSNNSNTYNTNNSKPNVMINFNVQKMDKENLDTCFNYVNLKFGTNY
jgi:uncharacterized coiled-coil protein SlyX